MKPDGLGDLVADGEDGIQACHRLLENHSDAVSANFAHPALGEVEDVLAGERDFARDDSALRLGDEPHNG